MKNVAIDEVEHVEHPMGINSVRRPLSEALETTDFGMVYYELEPGEALSGGLAHRHNDQEEVFYVLSGVATFEIGEDHRKITVGEGEVIRIPPGEFQKGRNDSGERVVALALSAPGRRHDWDELDVLLECQGCGTSVSTVQPTRTPNSGPRYVRTDDLTRCRAPPAAALSVVLVGDVLQVHVALRDAVGGDDRPIGVR
jgi:mannose-6-phosphate isomerase-like protein (cupin superfamily)